MSYDCLIVSVNMWTEMKYGKPQKKKDRKPITLFCGLGYSPPPQKKFFIIYLKNLKNLTYDCLIISVNIRAEMKYG